MLQCSTELVGFAFW